MDAVVACSKLLIFLWFLVFLGSDPVQRPSFGSIVESLKKLLKSPAQLIQMGG